MRNSIEQLRAIGELKQVDAEGGALPLVGDVSTVPGTPVRLSIAEVFENRCRAGGLNRRARFNMESPGKFGFSASMRFGASHSP